MSPAEGTVLVLNCLFSSGFELMAVSWVSCVSLQPILPVSLFSSVRDHPLDVFSDGVPGKGLSALIAGYTSCV